MMGSNVSDTKLKPTAKKPATRKPAPHAPELSKDDVYLFGIGMWERSWEKMGAHPDTQNRTRGWRFCVWAPDVKSVHVIGEFNDWDEQANPLVPVHTSAIWEGFIPGAEQGQLYKYLIETNEGEKLYKADPYAFKAALRVPRAYCGPSMGTSGTTPHGSSAAPAITTCRSPLTSTRCILVRGSATATHRRANPTSTAITPAPWIPSPRSAASSTPMTTCRWSSWTTCATWATRISRSCRLWSIPSMAPGATRRPATTPPRRATATRSSSCTLSMHATRRASA